MNGIDVCNLGCRDDCGDVQIAVRKPRRANANGLVGKLDMKRVAVGLAVNGDRANAEFPAGIDDAECDFTAIGYQNLTKHA